MKAAEATLKIAETKPTTLLTESAASKPTAAGDQEKVSTSSTTVAAEEPKRRSYQRVSNYHLPNQSTPMYL